MGVLYSIHEFFWGQLMIPLIKHYHNFLYGQYLLKQRTFTYLNLFQRSFSIITTYLKYLDRSELNNNCYQSNEILWNKELSFPQATWNNCSVHWSNSTACTNKWRFKPYLYYLNYQLIYQCLRWFSIMIMLSPTIRKITPGIWFSKEFYI